MKRLPRVLISIDWYLPGYRAGGPIQSCANLIAHLKHDFEFFVMTSDTDYTSTTPYPEIQPNTWLQLEENVQAYYFSTHKLSYASIKGVIAGVKADVIYINGIFSRYFSLYPLLICKGKYRKVIVAGRGMFAPGARDVKSLRKKLFFSLASLFKLYNGVLMQASNITEQQHISEVLGEDVEIQIAPNLPKVPQKQVVGYNSFKKSGELKLVSIARISPEKNTRFALELLAGSQLEGEVQFDLYGPINDRVYWQKCQVLIEKAPQNIRVQYKGSLSGDEVAPTLAAYHALFMPTLGENFGHIILESLMTGLPVLISNKTPWRNLELANAGYDLDLREPSEYYRALQELMHLDDAAYRLKSESARRYIAATLENEDTVTANRALFS